MSKWNRPMRPFVAAAMVCRQCGQPVRFGEFGGWNHVRRLKVRDPQWHRAEP